jgi:hypothetical protein
VAGFCEHGNESSRSIKRRRRGDFLPISVTDSQKRLCSMELVTLNGRWIGATQDRNQLCALWY